MNTKRTNPESLLNIRRIDSKRTHGFQVHIVRQGKKRTKMFSDSVYGAKDIAKEAAILYRDALIKKLPPSYTELGIQTSTRSNTGYTGVSYTFGRSSGPEGKKLPCFSVTTRSEQGKAVNRSIFIVDKGYKAALEEAIQIRALILAERERKVLEEKEKL